MNSYYCISLFTLLSQGTFSDTIYGCRHGPEHVLSILTKPGWGFFFVSNILQFIVENQWIMLIETSVMWLLVKDFSLTITGSNYKLYVHVTSRDIDCNYRRESQAKVMWLRAMKDCHYNWVTWHMLKDPNLALIQTLSEFRIDSLIIIIS